MSNVRKGTGGDISKAVVDTRPFHYGISDMAGFYFSVYGYRQVGFRAKPNVMITLAMPDEVTAMFSQNFANPLFILGHYANTAARRSALKDREALAVSRPISSSNSGAA